VDNAITPRDAAEYLVERFGGQVRPSNEVERQALRVALAYLADNWDDDGEAVTAKRLADLGGKLQDMTGEYSFFGERQRRLGGRDVLLWVDVSPRTSLCIVRLIGEEPANCFYFVDCANIGDVRRLLRGLKIKTQESHA
jgi:hypothetical protein